MDLYLNCGLDDITQHQEGVKMLITHIMRLSGYGTVARKPTEKYLEKAGKGYPLGIFTVVRGWSGEEGSNV